VTLVAAAHEEPHAENDDEEGAGSAAGTIPPVARVAPDRGSTAESENEEHDQQNEDHAAMSCNVRTSRTFAISATECAAPASLVQKRHTEYQHETRTLVRARAARALGRATRQQMRGHEREAEREARDGARADPPRSMRVPPHS